MHSAFALNSFDSFTIQPDSDDEYDFSISAQSGVLHGMTGEYVYNYAGKLSELDWDLKSIYYVGASAGIRINRQWQVTAGCWMGINSKLGNMQDYDWMNGSGAPNTHYSKHDCVLKQFRFMDVAVGRKYDFPRGIHLTPVFGIGDIYLKMDARDGYTVYPRLYVRENISGVGIRYIQHYIIPYVGASVAVEPIEHLALNGFFIATPLTMCETTDSHYLRNLKFYDSFYFIWYFSAGIGVSYRFYDSFLLGITGGYTLIPESRGDDYDVNTATGVRSPTYKNAAGISLDLFELRLSLSYQW
jgi:outer membrane protease